VAGMTFQMKEPYDDITIKYIHVRYLPKEIDVLKNEIAGGVTVYLKYEIDEGWTPYFIPKKEQDNEAYVYEQRKKERQKKQDDET
jgi:hypothetical protein